MMKFDFGPLQVAMRAATGVLQSRNVPCHCHVPESVETPRLSRVASAARVRRVAVARTLNAACVVCRGLGCVNCGDTGLD